MNKKGFAVLIAVLTFLVGVAIAKLSMLPQRLLAPSIRNAQLSKHKLSGPFEHENLTIFLIHGPDQPTNTAFTPLQEAMERKVVKVYETRNVNELAIENVSTSEEVFVQAGDMVKGGQQDRVLAVDLILPARSGKIPIDAFCVDQGRWQQRGTEHADHFSISSNMISNRDLKVATRAEHSQAKVWQEVDEATSKIAAETSTVALPKSAGSSLQLALENEKVVLTTAPYESKLASIVDGKSDVIGFAFAINNKLNSAEVYASSKMFKRFWPKLLKTAALEAVSERSADKKNEPILASAVGEFLVEAEQGVESPIQVTDRTHMVKREVSLPISKTDATAQGGTIEQAVPTEDGSQIPMRLKCLFFETRDMAQGGAWLHRSYLTK
jgi:ARG and Rhodanese-Phosphatase-superfamily-associated Protein domain